jgi:hypothetical protein
MPDKESGCSTAPSQTLPKLNTECIPHYNDEPQSPTSDILLRAVSPRDKDRPRSTLVQTDDGMCILCDSPQPEYFPSNNLAESSAPNQDPLPTTYQVSEHESTESHEEASSRTLTTVHGSSSNITENLETSHSGYADQPEHNNDTTTQPKGAPPPYADPAQRRASHERHEEPPRIKPRKAIGNFTLTNTLGSGSMGKVKLAVHNITDEQVMIKLLSYNTGVIETKTCPKT